MKRLLFIIVMVMTCGHVLCMSPFLFDNADSSTSTSDLEEVLGIPKEKRQERRRYKKPSHKKKRRHHKDTVFIKKSGGTLIIYLVLR